MKTKAILLSLLTLTLMACNNTQNGQDDPNYASVIKATSAAYAALPGEWTVIEQNYEQFVLDSATNTILYAHGMVLEHEGLRFWLAANSTGQNTKEIEEIDTTRTYAYMTPIAYNEGQTWRDINPETLAQQNDIILSLSDIPNMSVTMQNIDSTNLSFYRMHHRTYDAGATNHYDAKFYKFSSKAVDTVLSYFIEDWHIIRVASEPSFRRRTETENYVGNYSTWARVEKDGVSLLISAKEHDQATVDMFTGERIKYQVTIDDYPETIAEAKAYNETILELHKRIPNTTLEVRSSIFDSNIQFYVMTYKVTAENPAKRPKPTASDLGMRPEDLN